MPRLGQPEPGEHRRRDGNRRRRPDRRRVADVREERAERGPDDEAEAERRTEDAERLRAVALGRDVGDIGPRRRDVATREPVDDPRREQHHEAVRQRQHDEADHRAEQAEDEHRSPSVAIGHVAEQRRRDELAERERREEQADHERRRAERLGIEGQQRDDDPEADEIDEDREEDDEEGARHGDYWTIVTLLITTGVTGTSVIPPRVSVGTAAILSTTSMPVSTRPNTAYPKSGGAKPL